jgi:hypothetical protein
MVTKNKYSIKSSNKYKTKKSILTKHSILTSKNKENKKQSNLNGNSNKSNSFSIRFSSHRFYSKTHTARRVKRIPFHKDPLVQFIDDNHVNLKNGKILKNNVLDKYIFKDDIGNCICDNIFKKHLQDDCKCDNMKTYSSQGFSGASIHSVKCNQIQNILKVVPLSNYYMKLRLQTEKYMFIEFDNFTIQTLINTYIYKELPNNTVNIVNSGSCKNNNNDKYSGYSRYSGYNLMEEADLGSGKQFFNKLLDGKLDGYLNDEFNINSEDMRYKAVVNFLLQVVLIIGHLQSSSLEFFHGDFKPENVFVKRSNPNTLKKFKFNVFGKNIFVKNMGFSVLIADFDKSSISINSDYNNKKYRLIPPIRLKIIFETLVNNIIKKYGDIDPDNRNDEITLKPFLVSNFSPKSKDPTITILRSAGVKAFRDFDLYTFFITLLDTDKVKDYIISKKLDKTIMSFMSDLFKETLFSRKNTQNISIDYSALITVNILHKINEPMNNIFTDTYLKNLNILNYKLFR